MQMHDIAPSRPYGTVLANDIFSSGIILSEFRNPLFLLLTHLLINVGPVQYGLSSISTILKRRGRRCV